MKLKDATPEQIKKVRDLRGDGPGIHGILELPSGEEFLIYENTIGLSRGERYYIRAVPISLLDAEHWSLPNIPKIIVSIVPTNVGSEDFLFLPVVLNHVVNTYPEAAQESLFCVELDEIYMADYHSIGLGSCVLSWALDRCQQDCFENNRVITHVFGEIVPDDDDRLKDVIRFYRRNGFREAYGFIYRMIYPARTDMSKSL